MSGCELGDQDADSGVGDGVDDDHDVEFSSVTGELRVLAFDLRTMSSLQTRKKYKRGNYSIPTSVFTMVCHSDKYT